MSISSIRPASTQLAYAGNPLIFDFDNATTDQIIAHLKNNRAEQQRYLARVDDALDELFPSSAVDGAKSLSPVQTLERERILGLQVLDVMSHFKETGDTQFADELSPRYDRFSASPNLELLRPALADPKETVKGLANDREYTQQKYIAALEFYHETVRYSIESNTPTEAQLYWIKTFNDNAAYILANDPNTDASSQAFHTRLTELHAEGEALEQQIDIKLHHWRRG